MEYTLQVLRVVVAQICQAIGWHSIQSTPLELLVDLLHRYLQELARQTHRHTELYCRTEANLIDVGLAFRSLNINLSDLEEYINYVECVACAIDVPKYPLRKESNLNFLKPGSKEVLRRPVHIPEYLPPIYPNLEDEPKDVEKKDMSTENIIGDSVSTTSDDISIFKKPDTAECAPKKQKLYVEEEGRPTREMTSVMMTSSGFISPAVEGKLPDAKIPIIPDYKPPPPPPPLAVIPPPVLPLTNVEIKPEKKEKKKKAGNPSEKEHRKKDKVSKHSSKHGHTGNGLSNSSVQKVKNMKKQKGKQKHKEPLQEMMVPDQSHLTSIIKSEGIYLPAQASPGLMDADVKPKVDEIKLSSEPSKEKLNIFKKISTVKKEKDDLSRSPNLFHDSHLLSSIPEGTTITPAPPINKHHQHSGLLPNSSHTDEDQVICVDDESDYAADNFKSFTPSLPQNLLPPGTTIKPQTSKRPRKKAQQQQQYMQSNIDQNLPLNLSNEALPGTSNALNMVKKDLIHNARLSYSTFPAPKPQKEKKERKKPKAKENKKEAVSHIQDLLPPPANAFGDKKMRDAAAGMMFKDYPLNPKFGQNDNILPNSGSNSYAPPNFPNVPPIPMFPFYHFPPRPGLIPNPGLFPPLQPMADNPAFNKFLPMMRFGNFPNMNKGPRLTSTYDDEPPPLPPLDGEKTYCNVAPLVPDSMKFQLSPTRLKPKGPQMSDGQGSSGDQIVHSTSKETKILDSPIEISDDENMKSSGEEKGSPGNRNSSGSNSFVILGKSAIHPDDEGDAISNDELEKNERRKEKMHKKGKKEGKVRKKKEKKEKSKNKEGIEKKREKEEKKDKEKIKKLKKEKKKDKLRALAYTAEEAKSDNLHSTVPKLTLKIGLNNSPRPDTPDGHKMSVKSHSDDMTDSFDDGKLGSFDRRESSPELARISPLVTRPPKQKCNSNENLAGPILSSNQSSLENRLSQSNIPASTSNIAAVQRGSAAYAVGPVKLAGSETGAGGKNTVQSGYSYPKSIPSDTKSERERFQYESDLGAAVTTHFDAMSSAYPSVYKHRIPSSPNASDPSIAQPVALGSRQSQSSSQMSTFLLSAVESSRPSSYILIREDKKSDEECSSTTGVSTSQSSSKGPGRPSKNANHHSHISSSSAAATSSGVHSTSAGNGGSASSSTSGAAAVAGGATGTNANQNVQTTDAEGNQVWICPACGRVDDGTPMIGCDGCDAWYHWVCVGIQVPPDDNEDWYCRVCIAKKQEAHGADKKRKRKKKNKAN